MPCLSLRAPAALLTLGLASLLATPASAGECTYNDLLGTFSVTADCEGLQDHSNLGNEQKRMWLSGDWGQVNIIEVPPPYKQDAGQIDLIMSNLGRYYTERRSPGGIQETTVAGQDARVVLEHKMRTSSRSWVFHWQGRNLIMRAVAYGKKKQRMEHLDSMSAALTSTFAEAAVVAAPEMPAEKVRERKSKPVKEATSEAVDAAEGATMGSKERAAAAKDTATEAKDTATEAKDTATEAKTKVKAEATQTATEAAGEVKAAATETVEAPKKGSKERAAAGKAKAAAAADDAVDESADAEEKAEEKVEETKDEAEEKAKEALDDAADAAEKAGKGGL